VFGVVSYVKIVVAKAMFCLRA